MKAKATAILALLFCGAVHLHAAILMHRYSFSADASDSVGTANGSNVGAVMFTGGQAIFPSGPSRTNYLSLPPSIGTEIQSSTSITIELWFTRTANAPWSKVFMFGLDSGVSSAIDALEFTPAKGDPSGRSKVEASVDSVAYVWGRNDTSEASPIYSLGGQHYVTAVFDTSADSISFYSDGALSGTAPFPSSFTDLSMPQLFLGASVGWNDPDFAGSLNEFRVWNGSLNASEVLSHSSLGPDSIPEPTSGILLLSATALLLRRRPVRQAAERVTS